MRSRIAGDSHFVQRVGGLLPVSGNKRDGRSLLKKQGHGPDLHLLKGQFTCNSFDMRFVHDSPVRLILP